MPTPADAEKTSRLNGSIASPASFRAGVLQPAAIFHRRRSISCSFGRRLVWHASRIDEASTNARKPMVPMEIRLDREKTCLSVTWENGVTDRYPAPLLRERARDAASARVALDGWAVPAQAGLTITRVEPIGNYALRIAFSDGHDRGIFPWSYLGEIAAATTSRAC
jgi:DUF971 family protein